MLFTINQTQLSVNREEEAHFGFSLHGNNSSNDSCCACRDCNNFFTIIFIVVCCFCCSRYYFINMALFADGYANCCSCWSWNVNAAATTKLSTASTRKKLWKTATTTLLTNAEHLKFYATHKLRALVSGLWSLVSAARSFDSRGYLLLINIKFRRTVGHLAWGDSSLASAVFLIY